jgi:hypothetical protein
LNLTASQNGRHSDSCPNGSPRPSCPWNPKVKSSPPGPFFGDSGLCIAHQCFSSGLWTCRSSISRRHTTNLEDLWNEWQSGNQGVLFQGLECTKIKEKTRSRYTIWPPCSSRQYGHHGPCPQSNQRAAKEGIELAELAIVTTVSQGGYLIRPAVLFAFG